MDLNAVLILACLYGVIANFQSAVSDRMGLNLRKDAQSQPSGESQAKYRSWNLEGFVNY